MIRHAAPAVLAAAVASVAVVAPFASAAPPSVGDVPNCVFPCAALVDVESDRLAVYDGGADTVVCMAHGHLSELLQFVRS